MGAEIVKIVDVCEFYAPQGGGVRTYIHAKLRIGTALGHEIVVVVPSDRDEVIRPAGGGTIRLVKAPTLPFDKRYGMFWDAASVHAVLDAERPDVVEASSPWRGGWIAASWRGPALRSLFMHLDPLSAFAYRWFDGIASRETVDKSFAWFWAYLRRLTAQFELVVCASPCLTGRLREGGIGHAITEAMGVDEGVFDPDLRDPTLRAGLLARCALPEDATLLLGIGRHTPEKRWPCVIDAVAAVGAQRPLGLILVGDGHNQARVLAHIDGNPHIQPLAPIRDRAKLARIMASADALIHGSAAETFGLVAAEGLASGLPLILPDSGAVAQIARADFAETYATGDPRACAEAIGRMLDRDRMALRAAATQVARRARTLDDHFIELFSRYEAQLAGERRAA